MAGTKQYRHFLSEKHNAAMSHGQYSIAVHVRLSPKKTSVTTLSLAARFSAPETVCRQGSARTSWEHSAPTDSLDIGEGTAAVASLGAGERTVSGDTLPKMIFCGRIFLERSLDKRRGRMGVVRRQLK